METTYDLVTRAEAFLYCTLALLAVAISLYVLTRAWFQANEAISQGIYNRAEWEQQRQQFLRVDESSDFGVHPDTVEFFDLDGD